MESTLQGQRSTVRRLPDRGKYDYGAVYEILDAGYLCHMGFSLDGQPFVIPTLYARMDNKLYMHGSSASRTLRALQKGTPACVTVTLVDGLVLARSAFHHSINYRSVVAFGAACLVTAPDEKMKALEAVSEQLIPGRWKEARTPNDLEMKATAVIEFTIEEASAKVRTGPPKDDEEDYAVKVWAGVLPIHTVPGAPIADDHLLPGIEIPGYVSRWGK